eukprot:731729-Rhodomonas_salina.1
MFYILQYPGTREAIPTGIFVEALPSNAAITTATRNSYPGTSTISRTLKVSKTLNIQIGTYWIWLRGNIRLRGTLVKEIKGKGMIGRIRIAVTGTSPRLAQACPVPP